MEVNHVKSAVAFFIGLREEGATVSFTQLGTEALALESLLDHQNHYFIALEGNEVIGMLRARQGTGNQDHAALLTIGIAVSKRGKGHTSGLIDYAMEQIKARGISLARAYVYSDNRASIATVLSAGFTLSGCVYQHHRDLETGEMVDDLIFHRELS